MGQAPTPGSLLGLLHLSPVHLAHHFPFRGMALPEQGLAPLALVRVPLLPPPTSQASLCAPLSIGGPAGKEAFLTVGPGAGVRTFWFLPAPSGPDSGRTPGCTCTRTSSQALEAAPCPLCPGAGGSPHGSWGGEGAGKGWGGGAQVGKRGKRQRREREEERRDTHIHT